MNSLPHLDLPRWLDHGIPATPSLPPRIGLALSSGGARGLAHVGVLQVLEEQHIPIAALAGSSMGAYVGALWAAGLNTQHLKLRAAEIKSSHSLRRLMDFEYPPLRGLIRGERLRRHLERDLGGLHFSDLKVPLFIVATDLDSLCHHVFNDGLVAPAVHASAAIPALCVPVTINGRRYTDGGASEPLPVSLLRQHTELDAVIAVNVMPRPCDFEACRDQTFARCRVQAPPQRRFRRLLDSINLMADGHVIDTFRRALMSAQLRLIAKEAAAAQVVIQPEFESSSWHDFENFDRYIRAGRAAALAALPQIHALMNGHPHPSSPMTHETPVHPSGLGQHAA